MPNSLLLINRLFPLWALLLASLAYMMPALFTDLKSAIIPLLAIIMLAMGMTLTVADFSRVLQQPRIIFIGLALQFLVMPLAAYGLSWLLELSQELTIGMVLVGVSAGGTASNVICYLAKGNVALSITLTLCSTILAVIAVPALSQLYLGESVPVPAWSMLLTVLKIVVAPVLVGVLLNQFLAHRLDKVKPVLPLISIASIVLIIAIIVALNQSRFVATGWLIISAVILHNAIGLLAGYFLPRLLGYDREICRTVAIEVGMQNSGLSVALAIKYFSPLAALPGALFSIWHNLSGSLLASIWSRDSLKK